MSGERPHPVLTQEIAEKRAASVKTNLVYRIFIDFRKGENYSGFVRIEFRLKNKDTVFVDYSGDKVDKICLNGHEEDPATSYKDGRISLDAEHLKGDGKLNILHIKFSNRYYTDGNGIHTFTDVDGSQYLYTQSEPYWGNRVLPLFDQPDLKAQYILHAAAPKSWKVLTSVECTYTSSWATFVEAGYGSDYFRILRELFTDVPEGHNWWTFGSTVPLSTYLQNIVCGPYEVVHLETEKRYRGIPMAIYSRTSLIKYCVQEAHNIFQFNKKGIEFYEGLFNLEYPFGKLDTIFCPEYTVGAMEYPGAITYTERLLPKKKNTVSMVSLRGSVILHELAHMWFGNAVTMRWWNGLWLNESFADFVCYMAWAGISDKLGFETYDAWLQFMTRKGWGYKEDQEKTTHQIAACVHDTQVADNIFDGITYSKGAASLRQLVALVGREKFAAAISDYFQEHKFQNTDLEDLLNAFQKHLGNRTSEHKAYDIPNWQASWLENAGLNTVQAAWTAGTTSVTLTQGYALEAHQTLRFHRIDLALYNAAGEVVKTQEIILNDVAETVIEIEGGIGNDVVAILPNHNDLSFIKIIFEATSLAWFEKNLCKVTQPLAKGLILRAFYDGVRDARYKASSYIDVASEIISTSKSNQIIDLAFRYIGAAVAIIPGSKYPEYAHKLYRASRVKAIEATEPTFKLSMIEKMIGYGFHEEDIDDLKLFLEGTNTDLADNTVLSVSQKWSIVFKIHGSSKYDDATKKSFLDKLTEEDSSDTKRNAILKIEGLLADDAKRTELFADYFNSESKLSYVELRNSIHGFTSKFVSEEVRKTYFAEYFTKILDSMKTRSRQVAMTLWNSLFPKVEDLEYIRVELAKLVAVVEAQEDTTPYIKKAVAQKTEELARLIKARAFETA